MSTPQRPTHEEIAARAYELYFERGSQPGYDVDDWMQAEYELLQLPVHKLVELEPPAHTKGKPQKKSVIELVRAAMV